jgi:hypothetical protein
MKSWIYLLTTLWLLTACKADTEPEPETTQPVVPQHVAVTFNPEAAATRGPVPAGSLGTDLSFRVWATKTAVGTTTEAAFINDNTSNVVVYDDLTHYWRTTGATYYWPDAPGALYNVAFYALYPASAPTTSDIVSNKTITFDASHPIDGNTDVLYTKHQTSLSTVISSSSPAVPLRFHHALTQLAFQGKLSNAFITDGLQVTVGSIKVCSINSTGDLDLAATTTSLWGTLSTPTDYPLTMVSDEGIVLTNTAQALTSSSDITMVIPQVLTAWDPTTQCIYVVDGVSTKTLTTGSYLAIDCKIFDTQTGSYMIGDATSYETIYAPFLADPDNPTATWEPGIRYTYTLSFGSGYSSQGTLIGDRVLNISVSITPWDEGPVAEGVAA